MFVTKLKIATVLILCTGILTTLIGGSLSSKGLAVWANAQGQVSVRPGQGRKRRGVYSPGQQGPARHEPHARRGPFLRQQRRCRQTPKVDRPVYSGTPGQAESGQTGRRQAPPPMIAKIDMATLHIEGLHLVLASPPSVISLQGKFFKAVAAAKDPAGVAKVSHDYLDSLSKYIKDQAKANDVPDAMLQMEMVYRSLGKSVEANAWGEASQGVSEERCRPESSGRVRRQVYHSI